MLFGRFKKASKVQAGYKFNDLRFKAYHPVTLTVEGGSEDYAASVYDWNETEIKILVPRGKETGRVLELRPGEIVTVLVPQPGCAFIGNAQVKEVQGEQVTLSMPAEMDKRQQRQFLRVALELPLSYATDREGFRSTRAMDLSGGGAKFPVDRPHRRGDQVHLQFDIIRKGEVRRIAAGSRVVRIEQSLSRGTVIAVQFTAISEQEQEELIQYLLTQAS